MGINHISNEKKQAYHFTPEVEDTSYNALRRFNLKRVRFRISAQTSWFARIGLLGSIAWAIVAPAILGASLGLWIDTMYPSQFSWLMLLLPTGLFLGCLAAAYWYRQDITPKD